MWKEGEPGEEARSCIDELLGECSAFLASGSDPTDDRRRHKV